MESQSIKYDSFGRMFYNPEFHANHGRPWSTEDEQYLIDWYDIIGAEEMSLALERTIKTIMMRAHYLRKKGIMAKPLKSKWHERVQNGIGG